MAASVHRQRRFRVTKKVAVFGSHSDWHAAQTGTGYDAKAAEWKAKLAAM
jgi:hypothetical protein